MYQKIGMGDKKDMADVLNNVAVAYSMLNDHKRYLEYALRAQQTYEALGLGDHQDVAQCLGEVSKAYGANNDTINELKYAILSLEMYEKLPLTNNNQERGDFLRRCAVANIRNNNLAMGIEMSLKALSQYERAGISDSKEKAECLQNMGVV
jgi:hypothetical protein